MMDGMGRGAIARIITAAAAVTAASGAVALAASSNGIASKSPSEIVSAARSAVEGVSSVHVSGSGLSDGVPIALNLYLVAGKGGRGTVSDNGETFSLVVIGKTLYFEASRSFWTNNGGKAAANLFAGKWLKTPATGQFAAVSEFTDIHSLFTKLLSPPGALTRGPTSTLHGQPAVAVTDNGNGGTLYVATTGQPYPLEVVNNTKKHGTLVINGINQSVTLAAPKTSIDISKLGG
jgi:hypothetical protein